MRARPESRQGHRDQREQRQDRREQREDHDRYDCKLRSRGALTEPALAAVRHESRRVTEQDAVGPEHDDAEYQQGRTDRGRAGVVRRGVGGREEHVRRQHADTLGASEKQRSGELAKTEQQRDPAAVDERRTEQGQNHLEEHPRARRARHLRRLDQLTVDVLEARTDEQVDERRQRQTRDDHDEWQRVDVERPLQAVAPPGKVPQVPHSGSRARARAETPSRRSRTRRAG